MRPIGSFSSSLYNLIKSSTIVIIGKRNRAQLFSALEWSNGYQLYGKFHNMLDSVNLKTAVWIYDIENFCVRWANDAGLRWWESPSTQELYSRDFRSGASDAVTQSLNDFKKRFQDGESMCELWQYSPGGAVKQAFCQFSGVEVDNRMMMLVEATPVDVLQPLMHENTIAILATFDSHGQFKSCNPPFEKEFGLDSHSMNSLICDPALHTQIIYCLAAQDRYEIDVQLNTLAGKIWFRAIVTNSENEFGERTTLLHLYNIDERKRTELTLLEQANTDSLTGLMNRRGLNKLLKNRVDSLMPFSLFYIDLDGFKMINDSLGHATGDQILMEVANRLDLMDIKHAIPCRFGGDEFIFVIEAIIDHQQTKKIATDLVESLSALYKDRDENILVMSASIGFAKYPDDSLVLEDVIRFADAAMYNSKKLGKKRWTSYKIGMDKEILRKSSLAQHASMAISKNELSLHYQPIMDVTTKSISSFEALLRWDNPELGIVSPQELIGVCEEIGLITEIENWVIETALKDLPKLRRYTNNKATMSVNISGTHIVDPNLLSVLQNNLQYNELTQSDLIIEITENVLIEGLELIDNPVERITQAGFSLSIDDFGTGYSSLAYLHTLNADTVKIDRAFLSSAKFALITLDAIHKLIKALGMKSLIEGVETAEQAAAVTDIGIDLHQGYYYSCPQPLAYYKNK